jgi:predicted dinucleotide-binding enzyme
MRTYRCFLLDAQSHIASAQLIVCGNDDDAKLRAREILADKPAYRAIEVWDLDRRVHVRLSDRAQPPLVAVP